LLQFIPQVTDDAQNGSTKQLRERLMQEDADLTPEERSKIRMKLDEIADSGKWWFFYKTGTNNSVTALKATSTKFCFEAFQC
jgi:hypothetical protein